MTDAVPTPPPSRHAAPVERLRRCVLEGPGVTDAELRRAVAGYASEMWLSGGSEVEIPERLRPYVDKVAVSAYKVTDEDVQVLLAAGLSEDEVLEVTLAAALGCGLRALEVGLEAVGAGP